jgi:hypothetical protein
MTPHVYRLLQGFRADRPIEQAESIPASWYTDTELANWERDTVFAQTLAGSWSVGSGSQSWRLFHCGNCGPACCSGTGGGWSFASLL